MAANYQEGYIINATVQALCDVIRSPGFANQLQIGISTETPSQTGVCYQLYHGASMSSWGETITVALTAVGANVTQVNIRSECDMPTQIIDWGKNKQIVHNIHQYLETYVNRNPVMQNYTQAPPMQGAFCPRCGAPVSIGSNFCTVCGTRLN